MTQKEEIEEIKRRHSTRLLKLEGVCGVGIEKDEMGNYLLAIHLNATQPKAGSQLPDQIEGYPVKLIYDGPFRKLSK